MRPVLLALALLAGCGRPAPEATNQARPAPATAPTPPATPTRAAAPPAVVPRTGPWSPSGYALNGTEPFWGGTVTGTSIRYMVPEDQFGKVVETRATYGAERETYSGALRGRPFVLTLTTVPCSDGMSDHRYAFTAALQVGGEDRRGCADPQ
jgi:uncharacterized membrane protein